MAENADGSVVIQFDSDVSDAIKKIGKIKTEIQNLKTKISEKEFKHNAIVEQAQSMEQSIKAAKTEVEKFRQAYLQDTTPASEGNYNRSVEKLSQMNAEYQKIIESADKLAASIEQDTQDLQAMQQAGGELMRQMNSANAAAAKESGFTGFSFSSGFDTLKDSLNLLANLFKKLASIAAKATGSVLRSIWNLAKNGAKGLASLAGKAAKAFMSLLKSSNKTNKSFGSGIMTMLKYSLGIRGLHALFNKLRSAMAEGFKNLAKFSDPVNSAISSVTSALSQLKNSLATAFAPILTTVAPIITKFINMLSSAANAVARLTAALTGQKSYSKAIAVQKDYAASLEGTAGAAEDASKALAPFDEITKLSEETGGGGGGGAGAGAMFETEEVEPISFESWGQAFSAALDAILNDGIPRLKAGLTKFADWVNTFSANLSEMFTFHGVYEKVVRLGKELSESFNGLVSKINWGDLGSALGSGINTLLGLLVSAVYNFNWLNLGASIANMINNAISNINWRNVGAFLFAKFKIAIETLAGFLLNLNIPQLYQSASEIVIGFFDSVSETINNIDWKGLADQFVALVTGVFVSAEWDGMAESVFTAMGSAFGAAASFLWEFIQQAWAGVVKWWNEAAYEDGQFTMEGLLNGIVEKIKDIGAWIKEHIFQPFIDGFKAAFGIASPSTVMEEQGGFVMSGLYQGIVNGWQSIHQWLNDLPGKFKSAFNKVTSWVSTTFSSAWESAWGGLKAGVANAVNGVIAVINDMMQTVADGINNLFAMLNFSVDLPFGGGTIGFEMPTVSAPQIPYLAQGAVIPPNSEFLAVLGDQRRGTNIEAPLSTIQEAVSAVVNSQQQMELLREQNQLLQQILERCGVTIDGPEFARAVTDYQQRQNWAMGW